MSTDASEPQEPTSLAEMIRMEAEAEQKANTDPSPEPEPSPEPDPEPEPDPGEPSPEPDPEPEPEPAPAPSRGLVEKVAKKYGWNLDHVKDDDQLVENFVRSQQEVSRRNTKAQVLDTLVNRYGTEAVESWLRGEAPSAQAAAQQQAQQPQKPSPSPEEEVIDPAVLQQVTLDQATGQIVPLPGAPAGAVEKAQRLLRRQQEITMQLAADPSGFVAKILKQQLPQVEQEVLQKSEAHRQASQAADAFQGWVRENSPHLFVDGNPQAGFSEYGNAMAAEMNRLQSAGVRDPNQQLQLAYERVTPYFFQAGDEAADEQPAPQPAAAPAPQPRGKVRETSERAMHTPSVASREKTLTLDDLINEGGSLAEIYTKAKRLGLET